MNTRRLLATSLTIAACGRADGAAPERPQQARALVVRHATVLDTRTRKTLPDRAIVMITHYKRLLDYVEPDHVHVLQDGRIIQSGDKNLAAELERRGYGTFADRIDGDGPDADPLSSSSAREQTVGA